MPAPQSGRGSVLRLLVAVYLVIAFVDRVALVVASPSPESGSSSGLVAVFLVGGLFDLIAVCWLLAPAALYALVAPRKLLASRPQKWATRVLVFLVLGLFLFNVAAGWVFWEEFAARFNFIAVDYLVYTTEVIDNIVESYSLPVIFGGLLAVTAGLYLGLWKSVGRRLERPVEGGRPALLLLLAVPLVAWVGVDGSWARVSSDRYRNEIAMNGTYSLFAAFRGNTLDYEDNFACLSEEGALVRVHEELAADGLAFVSDDPRDLRRHRPSVSGEKRLNVVMIVVESLSANFMTMYDDDGKDLTPRLDALARESLVYTRLFASGGRTVRGLEALSLSIPPTPGRSIVKRPHNEGLDSIGWQFLDRGYDTRFFYGGYGYFDNMNYFFSSNGFRIVDRADLDESEVRFANAWGVCDQDVLARVLKEGDASSRADKPFFSMVMTTSNHRPYTYPDVVPLPSGEGRDGAVQYTDFAIGEFIDAARERRWFDQTIFVVVADHCASSAGRRDLEVREHLIPLLFYAPGIVEPGQVERLGGQVDVAPTLLALLDFDYTSHFFGHDLAGPGNERAFVGNHQTLGLYVPGELCLLRPRRAVESFQVAPDLGLREVPENTELLSETIACYQSAAVSYGSGDLRLDRDAKATRR